MNTNTIEIKKGRQSLHEGSHVTVIDVTPAPPNIKWFLSTYRKQEEDPLDEIPLPNVDTATLQSLFGQPQDNPMYDVYPVSEEQAKRLQFYVGHPLDLRKYDYFVECVAE